MSINSPNIDILVVAMTSSTRTCSRSVSHVDFQQIYQHICFITDGPQMIPRIEIGSIFSCLRTTFSICTLLLIVDINHFDRLALRN